MTSLADLRFRLGLGAAYVRLCLLFAMEEQKDWPSACAVFSWRAGTLLSGVYICSVAHFTFVSKNFNSLDAGQ